MNLFHPRIDSLVRSVNQEVILLIFLNKSFQSKIKKYEIHYNHKKSKYLRINWFRQWPSFHLCLVLHVLNLQRQTLLVHDLISTEWDLRAGVLWVQVYLQTQTIYEESRPMDHFLHACLELSMCRMF